MRLSGKICTILSAILLAACTYNPFSQNNHLTGSATGTVAGAAAGGTVAWLAGAPRPLIAVAGLGGGALGYYLTTLSSDAGGIRAAKGTVFFEGDYLTINLPADQLFVENSTELLPEATRALQSTAAVLAHFPNDNIFISGNSSGYGTQKFEQHLSERRARQVAAYLWAHGITRFQENGITSRKLTYVGYGSLFPVANDIRAASIRENSHIQITAYPATVGHKARPAEKLFANPGT